MERERTAPCIYYVCAHADCEIGIKDVTTKKCKNCKSYRQRKMRREEPISHKRQRDAAKHDDWHNDF